MATIAQRLQNLIDAANSTTTFSDDNLTDAVESLISGYGKGGGKTATVTITAPTGSSVTLTDGIETLTTVETDGVWVFSEVPLGYWTAVAVMPASTDSIDLAVLEDTNVTFYNLSQVVVLPGGSINNSVSDYAVQYEGSGTITAGNQVAGGQNADGALGFNTKSGYGYIPAAAVGARSFVFSIRFKASSFNTDGCIIAMHNANNNGINLKIGTAYLEIARNKDAIRRISRTVTLNEWHTVSMRYYGSTNTVVAIIDGHEVIREDVSGFEGYWTAFKINNMLAGSAWINNHATASYLTMYAEKITLLVG